MMGRVRHIFITTDDREVEVVQHDDQRDGPWKTVDFKGKGDQKWSFLDSEWRELVEFVNGELDR